MNYNFLLPNKPLPSYFKYVAAFIGLISLSIGFYIKLSNSSEFYEFTSNQMKWFLFIALFIFITSKNKIEDERTIELQLQIFRLGFGMFLGAIMISEGAALISNSYDGYQNFYYYVISILGFQALFFEVSKYSSLIDFIEKNQFLYKVGIIITMILILQFNRWLW